MYGAMGDTPATVSAHAWLHLDKAQLFRVVGDATGAVRECQCALQVLLIANTTAPSSHAELSAAAGTATGPASDPVESLVMSGTLGAATSLRAMGDVASALAWLGICQRDCGGGALYNHALRRSLDLWKRVLEATER